MHRVLVDEERWISEERFLHALRFCTLLPGPEAQQLATYVGWLMHGTTGALLAGLLFVLPGFLAILALSVLYVSAGHLAPVTGVFFGLKAAILAIVVDAVIRIGRRSLKHPALVAIAALAVIAIFAFRIPFPYIVAGSALLGVGVGKREERSEVPLLALRPSLLADDSTSQVRPSLRTTAAVVLSAPAPTMPTDLSARRCSSSRNGARAGGNAAPISLSSMPPHKPSEQASRMSLASSGSRSPSDISGRYDSPPRQHSTKLRIG